MHRRLSPRLMLAQDSGVAAGADVREIAPDTAIGKVRLTVSDLERSGDFYEHALGLRATKRENSTLVLGAPDGAPLVELRGDPSARPLDRRATGLFHMAILVPSRPELARSLMRLAHHRWPLEGASDHLVSEALYLSDPDGNGIEIYRDRPRSEWPQSNGQLRMATLPLDIDDLVGELKADSRASAATDPIATGTRMGHVHLQVSDLQEAERFYAGALGFAVTVRGYPGALFVSAGGYHHHIGLNTWNSAGAGPPPPGSIGLRDFEVVLPDEHALEVVIARARSAGIEPDTSGDVALLRDPSGNAVVLRAR